MRRGGISRTVFVISLVVVAAASGLTGYFLPGLLKGTSTLTLNGAGSSFVYPLISAMDSNYTNTNPGIQINYQSVGSGAGISTLQAMLADFGASDAPLSGGASGQYVTLNKTATPLTIPDTIGAVVVAYNLPGISKGLQLNANVTAKIFQGDIKWWNDSQIQNLQPSGVTLPTQTIKVIRRSDASGTTFVFTGYLKTASSGIWRLGQSTSPIPFGTGEPQNTGVATTIQSTAYSVGYVELDYALSASPAMTYAYMWNPAGGTYIEPTVSSTSLAASSFSNLPTNGNWTQVKLLNSPNPAAYPIVTFSYIMVYQKLDAYPSSYGMTLTRAQALVNYLWYIVHGGQGSAGPLNYVKLPPNVVANAEATIRMITYNGQTLHN